MRDGAIFRVDPWSGDRVLLVTTSGPGVTYPIGLAVAPGSSVPALSLLARVLIGLLVGGMGVRIVRGGGFGDA